MKVRIEALEPILAKMETRGMIESRESKKARKGEKSVIWFICAQ
jgi:hypothetical protein